MAWRLGGDIREVRLDTDSLSVEEADFAGQVEVRWPVELSPAERARRSACVAIAGACAEILHLGDGLLDDRSIATSWSADWRTFEAELASVAGGEESATDRVRREILEEVHALLVEPEAYERIARIVDALEAHGALDDVLFADAVE